MPYERSGSNDPLTRMTILQTSAILEMLSGLQILSHRWRSSEWKDEAAAVMGPVFMEDLKTFAERYQLGIAFIELALDYPDLHDVPGFISRVRTMEHRDLAFYLLGRVCPREVIPDTITRQAIEAVVHEHSPDPSIGYVTTPLDWADDLEAMRSEITRLWSDYWDTFFQRDMQTYREYWNSGNRELEDLLLRAGGTALYNKFCSSGTLPPEIPEGTPYTEIRYIPIYRPVSAHLKYFGYGNITILYDCKRNTKYEQSKETAGHEALQISRALGDEKRLRILKIISEQEFGLNGKSIAKEMELSPSVISRHLAQLRKAGLITEKSEDHRNITYRLNWKQVDNLSRSLMFYLGND